MSTPSIAELMDATGISKTYASDILADRQPPTRALAILIYRKTGWRPSIIAELSDEQVDVLESALPEWKPVQERAA